MIIIRFSGGLGNQIYQYVLYKQLKRDFPENQVKVDVTDYLGKNYHQGFEIEKIFQNVKLSKIGLWQIFKITSRLPVFYSGPRKYQVRMWRKRMNRKYFRKWNGNVVFGKVFIEEAYSAKMHERLQDSSQYTYIDKFFPPLQFFTGLESLIEDIQFVEFTDQRNIVLANEMKCQNSVSIHIRRGDYVGTNFDRVTIEYYKKAVEHIQNIIDDPKYYIFSDDIDYVTDNFKWLDNQVIVTNNRVENSYCDMQLMSMCKHNIITNSTFSTWGALLNKNANKVVCYPFLDEVIDRSWIGIRE